MNHLVTSFTFRIRQTASHAETGRSLGRPAIAVAAAAMAIYLAFAPNVVDRVEKEFKNEMAFARMPTKHWTIVHDAVEKVRSDEAMMNQLTESVRAEMSEAKKAARRTEE